MNEIKSKGKAPAFSLKDKEGVRHSLKDFDSEFIVLYFYPKDNTPGCTIEANMFSKDSAKYSALNTTVVGVSGGDEKTKSKFCERNRLKILLLSDTDFSVATKYGVYGEKSFMGRKYMGVSRVTFILDNSRKIVKVFDKVKPAIHSKEVLEFLKLNGGK
ncbi:thioredoxin-dependent thiol peroxidase [Candidatus Woesearchaeota archaeon]|nr:thioredoxin-dependent thiol peroxidase [Candidatus Woesearchaeota archaeon]MBT3538151.1 thioredoxin-dependent thiol peroxidase [Candidatus Woesearchaeota archaeon]MBT4697490.1 thioredoxin-dependent thiol peroxidase [Candidatus Woesearchaeota archaeon]MBT4716866.1 thioredoxin-dependent thiol peroxidase [Candidatus Woesearchaeota archaeon]MBT7105820.1 thioredoxin-dependent thiol peroxidase [Candidatus Woesearchaeota archaeon]